MLIKCILVKPYGVKLLFADNATIIGDTVIGDLFYLIPLLEVM